MTLSRADFLLSDEVSTFDLPAIAALLQQTYWAAGRSQDAIVESIARSTCLALTHHGKTIGFVRALTDHSVNSYICDFVVSPDYRGKELGTWMLETLMVHPSLARTKQLLITKDATAFYEKAGFTRHPYVCMQRPRRM